MIQHRIKEREPQYMDMKEIIAEAARKLILEKKVKKLTVKDIVEECQITRQAFYYHFEGIPDMIQWSIKQGTRRLLEACKEQGLPRRSCPLSAISSWMSAPDWKCSIAAAALRALSKLPPTAVAASMQISGRWRLPALAVKAESGAYR